MFSNPAGIFRGGFENDKWELYHVTDDYSEAHDLAGKYPEKLKELQAEFDKEARRNGVYPLVPLPLGAPTVVAPGKTHFEYLSGVDRLTLSSIPVLGGRSHKIAAQIEVPDNGNGVIVAQGGRYGGFTLYAKNGKLVYENNAFGLTHERVVSPDALPKGKVVVSAVFTVANGPSEGAVPSLVAGAPRPGSVQLFIGDKKVAEGKFSRFGGFSSSITETFDLGRDTGSPVSTDYNGPFAFTGKVDKVVIDLLK
jgi:hypothetical protein